MTLGCRIRILGGGNSPLGFELELILIICMFLGLLFCFVNFILFIYLLFFLFSHSM